MDVTSLTYSTGNVLLIVAGELRPPAALRGDRQGPVALLQHPRSQTGSENVNK